VSELERKLPQLVEQACQHPPGSPERQKNLTRIIRLTSSKLWRENLPYYQDALQQTWIFFCQNICEATTGQRYDPSRGSVVTWLNYYLRLRLKDYAIARGREQARVAPSQVRTSKSGDAQDMINPIDNLPANPDIPPILDKVYAWATADNTGELRSLHIEGKPHVNCQMLILRRLPPETSWKDLATEFGISVSTLSSFYQRQCLPRLRNFGESEGYI